MGQERSKTQDGAIRALDKTVKGPGVTMQMGLEGIIMLDGVEGGACGRRLSWQPAKLERKQGRQKSSRKDCGKLGDFKANRMRKKIRGQKRNNY